MRPIFLSLMMSAALCADDKAEPKPLPSTEQEKVSDGWENASPGSLGLKTAPLEEMLQKLKDGTYKNIHSVLLVKKGKLVLDEYFRGTNAEGNSQEFGPDTLHTVQSCTKSVTSILIGIAIDQKLIRGVDEPISTFFPKEAELFKDDKKAAILLKHCLSMSAGLSWNESGIPYTDPRNDAMGLNKSRDPVRYVFERSVTGAAGEEFLYHSGISISLGEALHHAAGMDVDLFAEKHLFGPLGITRFRWPKTPSGAVHTGGGLWLRPRDMAKLGQLFLNKGRWGDQQIVSEAWVRESTKQQVPYRGYGYQWWVRNFRTRDHLIEGFAAQGLGGQFIIVLPDLETVAVFTGWNVGALTEQPFDMLQRYIIPAVDVK
ncbi:6-aminohexanoate-dimer hydrolase [Brevifollis gellanilyticus]|uniref:6-aminohexanoate-dimer hydrolase n=2 Tax=Brevifollis gellanilyticus TaxID=748831 RepID=A0A512MJ40_9BACT|nr:6-aminohexanoate-dimer hydrolase [Brevifollis gellanilyticus]